VLYNQVLSPTGVLSGSMDLLAGDLVDVAVIGQYPLGQKELHGKYGDLAETDTESVTVTDVVTGTLLVVDTTIQKLLIPTQVAVILYVLVAYIVVVQGNV
jgi:hypothetical protein|tara:strand:- start:4282 stop:4581 length:300 start_codon:yes stop_codon:yes gene_type:complete